MVRTVGLEGVYQVCESNSVAGVEEHEIMIICERIKSGRLQGALWPDTDRTTLYVVVVLPDMAYLEPR